ncbi:hypothetical protein OZ410_07435 [Robiginitalea sp. M366]|uniref:hypothetical protein n=1 Tax=Robiginitalea aestuariiviva TaxID=3036903 RepID=UPI00240E2392|nr:hypothetical protein [Robiginitalea aestuariiviva]MDG1572144.1 hypothetical protein [Robiginitalea aestuariiviva]
MKLKMRILALLLPLFLISCDPSEDEVQGNLTAADAAALRATAEEGQWRITYFFDTDKEETADFNGYVFTFGTDGTVVAAKDGTEVSGTWSVTHSDSSPDDSSSSSNDVDFNLFFSGSLLFEDLNDDWDILEYTSTRIRLTDVSGGNGGTDFLTFERL